MKHDGNIEPVALDDLAVVIASAGRAGQDCAAGVALVDGYLLALADGAGGVSGGARAAETVIARALGSRPSSSGDCVRLFEQLDADLTCVGETTAVIVVATGCLVFGASVGDSEAWTLGADTLELTQAQRLKPLLGSGAAVPIAFGPFERKGRLLLGSDGLFKYVPHDRVRNLAASGAVRDAARVLVAAARLPSGGLQDDVAVILMD